MFTEVLAQVICHLPTQRSTTVFSHMGTTSTIDAYSRVCRANVCRTVESTFTIKEDAYYEQHNNSGTFSNRYIFH